jgi:DNA-binding Lrp family transcriptional regulator
VHWPWTYQIIWLNAVTGCSGDALVVAYVLITTATGKENFVLEQMRKLPGLSEVHQLFGQFDLIVRVETKDYDTLCDMVLGKFRTIPGVTGSRTLITARFNRE